MKEGDMFEGTLSKETGEYNLLADFAGGMEFDQNRIIRLDLDEISDSEFNQLLSYPKKIKLVMGEDSYQISVEGSILGGGDPTRPIRNEGTKIKPQQNLTILLNHPLDHESQDFMEFERVKLVILG